MATNSPQILSPRETLREVILHQNDIAAAHARVLSECEHYFCQHCEDAAFLERLVHLHEHERDTAVAALLRLEGKG